MTTPRNVGQLLGILVAALALALGPGGTALGAATRGPGAAYTAPLSGGEEVPPRATSASGEATFRVSADGQSLAYTVAVRDISNVTMGHIHAGAAGTNGDIVLPLVPMAPPGGGPRSGVIGEGTATAAQLVGPLQGKTMADLVALLDAGTAYVNIHTGAGASPATLQPGDIPPGELRGQIRPAGAPPGMMPRTGGGHGATAGTAPWAALAALATLALAWTLRRIRARA
jgi:hypothetical protein